MQNMLIAKRNILTIGVISFILLFCAFPSSCGTIHKVVVTEKDSTVIVYKDSTIIDTSYVSLPSEEKEVVMPANQKSNLATSIAESSAWVDNGLLHHTLRNKTEQLIPIIVENTITLKTEKKHVETPIIVEVEKKLSKWEQLKMKLGGYAMSILVLGALYLGFKLFTRL